MPAKKIIRLSDVDSTNNYAAHLIQTIRPNEGTIVSSEYQEKGKGQSGAAWESRRGENLLASFILYPSIEPSRFFLLNQCISLAVHEVIKNETADVKIKWPNDIMAGGKKIAGILIENSIRGNNFVYSVAGTGININQDNFLKYNPEATSLFLQTGYKKSVDDMLNKLSTAIEKWYGLLCNKEYDFIQSAYLNSLFLRGIHANFKRAVYNREENSESDVFFSGVITGVSGEGKLLIETGKKDIEAFDFKQIKFI